ncbi:hypothetical protein EIP91_010478 [Steccherinum ochraceum]|uniref:Glycosyltransferase family 49 protein n=1 Tax=Steccherinum ochraceum TaxID=92696 RepID=A0A4R0RNC2_9APHY|nr:hypothetical protein EIP91_010478 [Steccherinum ochraceum]
MNAIRASDIIGTLSIYRQSVNMASIAPFIPKPGDIDHNKLLVPLEEWVKERITAIYAANSAQDVEGALDRFITGVEEGRRIETNGESVSYEQYKSGLQRVAPEVSENDVDFVSVECTPDDVNEPKLAGQLAVFVLVLVSVSYTTKYLAEVLVLWFSSFPASLWKTSTAPGSLQSHQPATFRSQNLHADVFAHLDPVTFSLLEKGAYYSNPGAAATEDLRIGSTFRQQLLGVHDTNSSGTVSQETLLSKAFSHSLHPTRVIPYFYKASGTFDEDDVTITTLVTSNRFKILKQLVDRYRGPISVTIHIPFPSKATLAELPPDSPSLSVLRDLHALYHSTPHFATYVDVHLAFSPFARKTRGDHSGEAVQQDSEGEGARQFNVWRNVARLFARTEFVMMLDVDFAVCTDWRGAVRKAIKQARIQDLSGVLEGNGDVKKRSEAFSSGDMEVSTEDVARMLRDGTAALVVPVFEYISQEDGEDSRTFPQDKESLLRLINAKPPIIASFHASWAPGHNSTDYARYYSIAPGANEIYKVETYQSAYEPYVITSKRVPWCDERFTGYGANKAACLFEMYLSGVSFYVLSDHFLIHQSHKYEEEARREERKYNRKLYTDFKEEACLRYLYRFHNEGILDGPRGVNVKEECKKIKSVVKIAAELFGVVL